MIVSDRDIDFFAKKLKLSAEKTFLLIQDPDCLPEILNKISEEDINGIVDISFPVFAEITIIKYSKDLKYSFEEKEYVSESIGSKFYDLINIKLALLLFITYYILNTDIFIEKGLSRMFCNVYDTTHDKFTEKGIIISGIILSMCYILYDFLDKKNII